jgi:hypothetical protein
VDTQKIVVRWSASELVQTGFDFFPPHPKFFACDTHQEAFIAAGLAGDDLHGGFGAMQPFGKTLHKGFVGFALYRRGVQFDFESAVVFPDNGILCRFGLNPYVDQQPFWMVMKAHVTARIGFRFQGTTANKGRDNTFGLFLNP